MNTEEEKESLLLEMIAFSTVDGQLHKRELEFLWLVAQELNVDRALFQIYFIKNILLK
jgi:hypothetical protein